MERGGCFFHRESAAKLPELHGQQQERRAWSSYKAMRTVCSFCTFPIEFTFGFWIADADSLPRQAVLKRLHLERDAQTAVLIDAFHHLAALDDRADADGAVQDRRSGGNVLGQFERIVGAEKNLGRHRAGPATSRRSMVTSASLNNSPRVRAEWATGISRHNLRLHRQLPVADALLAVP